MNKYVALMIHFKNVPLIPNFCAERDKVSSTTHLTNAEELSTSLYSMSDVTTTLSANSV